MPARTTPDEPGHRGPAGVLLREALAELDEHSQVGVATGVLMWRHGLSADEARARLAELAEERGLSVAEMADLLQPSGS